MDITQKCSNCGKFYFIIKGEPCPFCGSKNVDVTIASIGEHDGDRYCVSCSECGCDGPWYNIKTEENAIKFWNRREE